MKFREQRGSLSESMQTLTELPDRTALVEHCQKLHEPFAAFEAAALKVEPYCGADTRIGWDATYVVTVEGCGVVGFTDSAC